MSDSTATKPPTWGDSLLSLLNKGVDTAASYAASKLQADAMRKAQEAAYRSDMAAANAAVAGTKSGTSGAGAGMPAWVAPVGVGVGVLAVIGILIAVFRGK